MGQKVNPHGARVGVIFDWSTRWYAGKKDFANNLIEDFKLRKMLKEKFCGHAVNIRVVDIKTPDADAQLIAENIAQQLEKRIAFRRAMKQSIMRANKAGAKGVKIAISGRLGGADIARTEHYHEGSIPLQTLRANIDYGFAEAKTTYGRLGVKVWVYKGQILPKPKKTAQPAAAIEGGK